MSDKPKGKITYSNEFINTVCSQANELLSQGKNQATVDDKHFGQLSVFIDQKPNIVFMSFPAELLDPRWKGKIIYVGG